MAREQSRRDRKQPQPHDMGRATVGYYVVEGKLLMMTHGDGKPFHGRSGEKIAHKLQPGDDPTVIAKRLTLQIHRASRGDGMPDLIGGWTILHWDKCDGAGRAHSPSNIEATRSHSWQQRHRIFQFSPN